MRNYCCFSTMTEEMVEEVHRKGNAAWEQYRSSKTDRPNPRLLTEAIDFYNQALTRAQSNHPSRPIILMDLILALLEEKNPSSQHLALIELHFAEVIRGGPLASGELKRDDGYSITTRLGELYERLYNLSSDPSAFDRCLFNYTEAARSYAPSPEKQIQWFLTVARLYSTREEDSNLERALNAFYAARGLCQDEDYRQRLDISEGIYAVHKKRYLRQGEKATLERAIAECDYALTLRPPEEDRNRLLYEYLRGVRVLMEDHGVGSGNSLRLRAVVRGRELLALPSTYPDREESKREATLLLANMLSWGRKANPSIDDLDEAITKYTEIMERDKPRVDRNLLRHKADAIWLRSRKKKDPAGLPEAIDLYGVAFDFDTDDPSWKPSLANNIAAIYLDKANFNNKNIEDLEKAREFYRTAVKLASNETDKASDRGQIDKINTVIRAMKREGKGEGEGERGRNHSRKLSGERRRSLSRSSKTSIKATGAQDIS
ncbi:hypothetical protein DFP72DRAFT_927471 [Ephemerocybe angulata]|uniref:Uncharacterized protein n=1 Tax=Ephemerocybe angulata TaxID=980116 RepID=A0A8H6LUY5_9AGAR|nr:hypothetical protein DFP72DRAFT_927471 [Tulosesus angulatus]